jgi:hypothetical protein
MKILGDYSSKYVAISSMVLLLGAMAIGVTALPSAVHAASTPVGIVIPLYTYPTDGTWTTVINAKHAYPNVPFIAVINPASGPGTAQDSNYVQGIKNLQAAGIKVLGYVATGYTANSIASDESKIALYNTWYAVNGIMFDEMSNTAGAETYYSTLNSYVHSLVPGSTTMGNPGTSVPTSFIGTMDALCIYESGGYPSISFITYNGYSPSNFGVIAFGVGLDTTFLSRLSGVSAWVYATNANLPNPYGALPSYFTSEVAALSSIDSGTTTSTSSSTPSTSSTTTSKTSTSSSTTTSTSSPASLSVSSVSLGGSAVKGIYTTWNQNGVVLATGFTPTTFTGTSGGSYTVSVSNYLSTVFCHWLDGNTNPTRTLTLTGNTGLTAVYSTTGSCSPAPPTTYAVTFTESGLTAGTSWSVTLNSATLSSTSTSITFNNVAGGSFSWSTAPTLSCGTGCQFVTSPSSGTLNVPAQTSQALTYTKQFQVTLAANPTAAGTTSPSAGSSSWVNAGASLPLAASPASGYAFTSWTSSTGTLTFASSTSASTTTTVQGAGTITANFKSTAPTIAPPSTVSITINTKSVTGVQFTGIWLTVTANGKTVASGYSTLTFTATVGVTYTITVINWYNYVFAHWENGSPSPARTITATQATTLTAYYNTGGLF